MTIQNKRFIDSMGIKIDNIPRNFLTVNLVNNAGFNIRTPITFTMGDNDLEKILSAIKRLGFPGRRVVRALTKAIENLTKSDLDEIKNNFWCVGYAPEDVIKYAIDVLKSTMAYHHMAFIPVMELDKPAVKNFVRSFGGYRGVQALFTDVIEKTVDEFRRIQKAEAVLNRNKIESEIASDQLGSIPLTRGTIKSQCLTCKHCYTDKYGYRICMKKSLPVPTNLTIAEANAMYPRLHMRYCDEVESHFIMHEVTDCAQFVTRIY